MTLKAETKAASGAQGPGILSKMKRFDTKFHSPRSPGVSHVVSSLDLISLTSLFLTLLLLQLSLFIVILVIMIINIITIMIIITFAKEVMFLVALVV